MQNCPVCLVMFVCSRSGGQKGSWSRVEVALSFVYACVRSCTYLRLAAPNKEELKQTLRETVRK